MVFNYQRRTLVPPADVGGPSGLPAELVGLEDVSLADLPLAIGMPAATQLGYLNTGYLPVPDPPPDPPVPTPLPVFRFQLLIAAFDAALLDDIIAGANALAPVDQIRFQNCNEYFRDQPIWPLIGAQVGISPATFDALFVAAALVGP